MERQVRGDPFAADLIPPPNMGSPNSEFGEFDPPKPNSDSVNSWGVKIGRFRPSWRKTPGNLKEFAVF